MNTTGNNKLIAEFMGIPSYEFRGYTMFEFEDDNHRTDVDLHYHTSWEWLMPVVVKIESRIGASIIIGRMFCEIKYTNPLNESENFDVRMSSVLKINAVYSAVVEFIKWYNENK